MKKLYWKLLKWATKRYVKRHTPYIIGITGSVGKTSSRMMIAQTLRYFLPTVKVITSPQNFNTEIGLCLALLAINNRPGSMVGRLLMLFRVLYRGLLGSKIYDVVVAEYGIDTLGDMNYLVSIARPNIGLFTILDKVHAEGVGTPDAILEEKMQLLHATKEVALVSAGSLPYTQETIDVLEIDTLVYALDESEVEQADIRWRGWQLLKHPDETITSHFDVEQGKETVLQLTTNLLSKKDAGYCSVGVELAMILSQRLAVDTINMEDSMTIIFEQQPSRFSILPGQFGSVLLDSSYNAAPKSMKSVVESAIQLRKELYPTMGLIYCLGDMRELGEYTEQEHRKLASTVAQSADAVYLVGASMKAYMLDELEKVGYSMNHVHRFENSTLLGQQLLKDLPKREHRALVVFKGSQNTIYLEESVKQVLKNKEDTGKLCRQSKFRMAKK